MTNDALIAPATGIKNISQIDFTITPNPANDKIVITALENKNGLVEIVDITVRTILQKRLGSESQTQINIDDLSLGTYFVQLMQNDKRVGTKKLVVIR